VYQIKRVTTVSRRCYRSSYLILTSKVKLSLCLTN
jgi:hypothetical protein